MNDTAKITKSMVLSAARKRWSGAQIRHDPGAPDQSERDRIKVECEPLRERRKTIAESVAKPIPWSALIDAARTARDLPYVPGAIKALSDAVDAVDEAQSLRNEDAELKARISELTGPLHRSRYAIYYDSDMFRHVRCTADTLEGLLAAIEATP